MVSGDKIPLHPRGKGSYALVVDFVGGGRTEIIVDSGAEDSVCPRTWRQQLGICEPEVWMNFKSASGDKIQHYGHRDVYVTSPF